MKKYFAQLRPLERRLAVGVLVVVLLVLNFVYIWPHRHDWGNWEARLADARIKLALYQKTIKQTGSVQSQVNELKSKGEDVAQEDQSVNFMRTIQSQSSASGVAIISTSRLSTKTNDVFFVEQMQNINVSGDDKALVDFLFKLGSGASMTRVRDLELQPDAAKTRLTANIQLVASYQKNPKAPVAKAPTGIIPRAASATTPAIGVPAPGTKPLTKPVK